MEQVWFAGVHSDVGGGYAEKGLADLAFMWMKRKAVSCDLAFDEEYVNQTVDPNAMDTLHNSKTGMYRFTSGHTREIGSKSTINEAAHHQAVVRFNTATTDYRAGNLGEYLADPEHAEAEAPGGV